jgi:hypothetical protein
VHRLDDAVLTLQSGQRVDTPLSVYLERGVSYTIYQRSRPGIVLIIVLVGFVLLAIFIR